MGQHLKVLDNVKDRCWSLAPLSVLSAMLAVLIAKNTAIFYVAMVDEFGVSHQSATWPCTVVAVMVQTSGFLVSVLQKKLSIYHIAIVASFLNFAGLVGAAFAPNIVWMCFTLGLISGMAVGIQLVTLSVYAMLYFEKYRATASGFKYTGMSLAPLLFSVPISAAIQIFGMCGSLLLLSAVMLNTLPLAMLMNNPRPVSFCNRKFSQRYDVSHNPTTQADGKRCLEWNIRTTKGGFSGKSYTKSNSREAHYGAGCVQTADTFTGERTSQDNACGVCVTSEDFRADVEQKENCDKCEIIASTGIIGKTIAQTSNQATGQQLCVRNTPKRCKPEHSATCRSRAEKEATFNTHLLSSVFVIPGPAAVENAHGELGVTADVSNTVSMSQRRSSPATTNSYGSTKCNSTTALCQHDTSGGDAMSDKHFEGYLSLLRNPAFYLLGVSFGLVEYISNTFEQTVLDYAMDKGATEGQALPIVTYVAAAEIAGRLAVPLPWDLAGLRRSLLVAVCMSGASACFVAMPHALLFSHVVVTAVAVGVTTGCTAAMKPVLLSDWLGVHNLPFCWGVVGVAALPTTLGGPKLIGIFRDTMGSYDNLYRMLSGLCAVVALLLFGLAFFEGQRKTNRRACVARE